MQHTRRPPSTPRHHRGPNVSSPSESHRIGRLTPPAPPCDHSAVRVAGLDIVACGDCGTIEYTDTHGTVLPTVALARLFGDYDLVGVLPTVHAPGQTVRLYRPPSRGRRRHLEAFPVRQWFEVDAGLWLSHDGEHLLLATQIPVELGPADLGPSGA